MIELLEERKVTKYEYSRIISIDAEVYENLEYTKNLIP